MRHHLRPFLLIFILSFTSAVDAENYLILNPIKTIIRVSYSLSLCCKA